MSSLTVRLFLSFLTVTLIGVLLVAFIISRQTERAFTRFLLDHNQEQMMALLTRYYAANGSWDGLSEWWSGEHYSAPPQSPRRNRMPAGGIVVDLDRQIVLPPDLRGRKKVSEEDIRTAVPIVGASDSPNEGEIIGHVLFDFRPAALVAEASAALFLKRLREAVVMGALGSILIALLAALVLARTITRPILKLKQATEVVADGGLGFQVPVRTRDEIGDLALAFNQMSSSLEESTRLRRQMTADIAHDLRTPLSVILGYTEALNDGKLTGSPELYETVHGEAKHLNRLIDDLRILSLADAGELSLQRVEVAPADLLARAAAAHFVHTEERSISLVVDCEPDLPLVSVDLARMAQVLDNLLINALRHTPDDGEILLSAQAHDQQVTLSVIDSGEGIASEDLPRIFDRFYRGDQSRGGNGESGLGLPIVKSIILAHGGSVQVRSEPGMGAEFSIELPAIQPV